MTVYQRALTAAEIATIYAGGLAESASAAWSFSDVQDGRATDATGNGNTATIVNGVVAPRDRAPSGRG